MIISFDELARKIGSRRVCDIKAWCARNRVHWFPDAKGRPMTTLTALDRALMRGKDEETEPNFDLLSTWANSRAGSKSPASTKKTGATTGSRGTSGTG